MPRGAAISSICVASCNVERSAAVGQIAVVLGARPGCWLGGGRSANLAIKLPAGSSSLPQPGGTSSQQAGGDQDLVHHMNDRPAGRYVGGGDLRCRQNTTGGGWVGTGRDTKE